VPGTQTPIPQNPALKARDTCCHLEWVQRSATISRDWRSDRVADVRMSQEHQTDGSAARDLGSSVDRRASIASAVVELRTQAAAWRWVVPGRSALPISQADDGPKQLYGTWAETDVTAIDQATWRERVTIAWAHGHGRCWRSTWVPVPATTSIERSTYPRRQSERGGSAKLIDRMVFVAWTVKATCPIASATVHKSPPTASGRGNGPTATSTPSARPRLPRRQSGFCLRIACRRGFRTHRQREIYRVGFADYSVVHALTDRRGPPMVPLVRLLRRQPHRLSGLHDRRLGIRRHSLVEGSRRYALALRSSASLDNRDASSPL